MARKQILVLAVRAVYSAGHGGFLVNAKLAAASDLP